MKTDQLLDVIRRRRSVRVYKKGKVNDEQLQSILEAARWAPSGANTQPWEFVVTRDRKKMKRVREIYSKEWRQRKKEDPVHYKGLKKRLCRRCQLCWCWSAATRAPSKSI